VNLSSYAVALLAHSYLRWLVLAAMLVVIARSAVASRRGSDWATSHSRLQGALVNLADLQLTLGVCLYVFWSPLADAFMRAPAATMKEHTLRFFGLEHPTMMVLAVALLHVSRLRGKKATTSRDQHRVAMRWTLAALLVVCSSIPWPGLRHGRPLLRTYAPEHER